MAGPEQKPEQKPGQQNGNAPKGSQEAKVVAGPNGGLTLTVQIGPETFAAAKKGGTGAKGKQSLATEVEKLAPLPGKAGLRVIEMGMLQRLHLLPQSEQKATEEITRVQHPWLKPFEKLQAQFNGEQPKLPRLGEQALQQIFRTADRVKTARAGNPPKGMPRPVPAPVFETMLLQRQSEQGSPEHEEARMANLYLSVFTLMGKERADEFLLGELEDKQRTCLTPIGEAVVSHSLLPRLNQIIADTEQIYPLWKIGFWGTLKAGAFFGIPIPAQNLLGGSECFYNVAKKSVFIRFTYQILGLGEQNEVVLATDVPDPIELAKSDTEMGRLVRWITRSKEERILSPGTVSFQRKGAGPEAGAKVVTVSVKAVENATTLGMQNVSKLYALRDRLARGTDLFDQQNPRTIRHLPLTQYKIMRRLQEELVKVPRLAKVYEVFNSLNPQAQKQMLDDFMSVYPNMLDPQKAADFLRNQQRNFNLILRVYHNQPQAAAALFDLMERVARETVKRHTLPKHT